MPRHLGFHLAPPWTLVLLDSAGKRGPAAPITSARISTRVADRAIPEALAWLGLFPLMAAGPDTVFLAGTDEEPLVQFHGPADATSTPLLDPAREDFPQPLLEFLASELLQNAIHRLELSSNQRLLPIDSLTLCVTGATSGTFHLALANAAKRLLGIAPTFLWRPTALGGLGLLASAARHPLVDGRPIRFAVGDGAGQLHIQLLQKDREIRSSLVSDTSATPVVSITQPETDAAAALACGAALWGWWGWHTGSAHHDQSPHSIALLGRPEEGSKEIELMPLERVPVKDEDAQWYARAAQPRNRPRGPLAVRLMLSLPWAQQPMPIASQIIRSDQLLTRWQEGFSIAVALDGMRGGWMHLVEPHSAIVSRQPLTILPSNIPSPPAPHALRADEIRSLFEKLPEASEPHWDADPATGATLQLALPGEVLPVRRSTAIDIPFLRFASDGKPIALKFADDYSIQTRFASIGTHRELHTASLDRSAPGEWELMFDGRALARHAPDLAPECYGLSADLDEERGMLVLHNSSEQVLRIELDAGSPIRAWGSPVVLLPSDHEVQVRVDQARLNEVQVLRGQVRPVEHDRPIGPSIAFEVSASQPIHANLNAAALEQPPEVTLAAHRNSAGQIVLLTTIRNPNGHPMIVTPPKGVARFRFFGFALGRADLRPEIPPENQRIDIGQQFQWPGLVLPGEGFWSRYLARRVSKMTLQLDEPARVVSKVKIK